MLHAVTLLPLLLPIPAATPASDRLLSALPPDTFLSVHATNPRALVASRETSDWVAFALDRQWDRVCHTILDEMGDDVTADEVIAWRDRIVLALSDATEAVAFIAGDFTTNEPTSGILVQGGPEAGAVLREFLGTDSVPSTIAGGRSVLLSESGRGELFYENEGVILVLSSPTIASARTVAARCLDALDAGGAPAGPFAIPGVAAERGAAQRRAVPAFELAADLSRVWSSIESIEQPEEGIEQRTFDGIKSMEWVFASATFGDGESVDWSVVAPYGEATLLGQFLGHLGTADKSLLNSVPSGALSGAVVAFDVSGFTDWVLEIIKEESPEARAQVDGALVALTETTGIDVMGQIVDNLRGQFLYFASPEPLRIDGIEIPGPQSSTLVATVDDADPLIDIVEQLLDMSGMGARANTGESAVAGSESGLETWTVDSEEFLPFAVAVGAQRLALSIAPRGFDAYLALARTGEKGESLMSNRALQRAVATLDGAAISVQPTASIASAIETMVTSFDSMARQVNPFSDEPSRQVKALSQAANQVAAMVRQYFEGTTMSVLSVSEGRIRFQTMAR